MATWPKILLQVMENYVGWFSVSISQIEVGPNLMIQTIELCTRHILSREVGHSGEGRRIGVAGWNPENFSKTKKIEPLILTYKKIAYFLFLNFSQILHFIWTFIENRNKIAS